MRRYPLWMYPATAAVLLAYYPYMGVLLVRTLWRVYIQGKPPVRSESERNVQQ